MPHTMTPFFYRHCDLVERVHATTLVGKGAVAWESRAPLCAAVESRRVPARSPTRAMTAPTDSAAAAVQGASSRFVGAVCGCGPLLRKGQRITARIRSNIGMTMRETPRSGARSTQLQRIARRRGQSATARPCAPLGSWQPGQRRRATERLRGNALPAAPTGKADEDSRWWTRLEGAVSDMLPVSRLQRGLSGW